MTKRLQVLLDDDELQQIQQAARDGHITVAAWVRSALRAARQDSPTATARKLAVLRRATRHEFPTAEIAEMIAEIEGGYATTVDVGDDAS
jgi:hypothetical protein